MRRFSPIGTTAGPHLRVSSRDRAGTDPPLSNLTLDPPCRFSSARNAAPEQTTVTAPPASATRPRGCDKCGYGFVFELLDDYYPASGAAFFVCDQEARIIGCGRGSYELTGLTDIDVFGRPVRDVLGLEFSDDRRSDRQDARVGRALDRPRRDRSRRGRFGGQRRCRYIPRVRRRRGAVARTHARELTAAAIDAPRAEQPSLNGFSGHPPLTSSTFTQTIQPTMETTHLG